MSIFRKLPRIKDMLELFKRSNRWLIVINADPDAMASAMALKRIMSRRTAAADIAYVNTISRPDNLEMIDSLHIPLTLLTPTVIAQYDKFALVDSQPHHHEFFADITFSLVIDHHPVNDNFSVNAEYTHIEPDYGACASMLTEYLFNLGIRPGKMLATALQYGIKTDTSSFERDFIERDLRAYQYLNKHADHLLLRKIYRSDFRLEWLRYFCAGYSKMRLIRGGIFVFLDDVENADVLVILADQFLRVHQIGWTAVCGVVDEKLTVIFRGSGGRRDMGKVASACFGKIGSAGGHRGAARAEIEVKALSGVDPEIFAWEQLYNHWEKPKKRS